MRRIPTLFAILAAICFSACADNNSTETKQEEVKADEPVLNSGPETELKSSIDSAKKVEPVNKKDSQ
jgi:hypothetical protein